MDTKDIREDYLRFLKEYGLTQEYMDTLANHKDDHSELPTQYDAVELRPSSIHGVGIHATRDIEAGEVLGPMRVGDNRTILGRHTNHSPLPNCYMNKDLLLVSLVGVPAGEELSVDYRQVLQVRKERMETNIPERIEQLTQELLKAPQVDVKTSHALSGGIYARTMYVPAGTLLTGATHKKDHINVFIGDFSVSSIEGLFRYTGHHVIECKAGIRRAILAHVDGVWTTLVRTDLTEINDIEDESVVESGSLQTRQDLITHNQKFTLEIK